MVLGLVPGVHAWQKNEGIAFPVGTMDTFVAYGVPANLIETVNTVGLPIYARQVAPAGWQRDRREDRRLTAAGEQAAPPRRQDIHQQLKA